MAKLAQQHGFAIRTFNRRFKLATGLTPMDYLQQRRLQAAASLLRDSNLTVAEIGQQVGYGDASYFTKVFRRQFSMTPQKYRESVRGKLFAPG
jgi:transcriptional regulator GlxA family with amidase domain